MNVLNAHLLRSIQEMGDHELRSFPGQDAMQLKVQFRDVPEEYVQFLLDIGYGHFGNCLFSLYPGLMEPSEFYPDDVLNEMDGLMVFGADFNGTSYAFDFKANCGIVEITPTLRINRIDGSFEEFIRHVIEHRSLPIGRPCTTR